MRLLTARLVTVYKGLAVGQQGVEAMSDVQRATVVTGAASGIGKATAELFAERGYGVVAVDLSAEGLRWTEAVDGVVALAGDVSQAEANEAMVALALERFGRLDVAVLNAGIVGSPPIEGEGAIERLDAVLAVNVRGVVLGIRHAAPAMRASGGGAIVATASTSGLRADPGSWAYNASKAAVINLVRAAALDYAMQGIRVNAVAPGPTDTGMTRPLVGRDTEPVGDDPHPGAHAALRDPMGAGGSDLVPGLAGRFLHHRRHAARRWRDQRQRRPFSRRPPHHHLTRPREEPLCPSETTRTSPSTAWTPTARPSSSRTERVHVHLDDAGRVADGGHHELRRRRWEVLDDGERPAQAHPAVRDPRVAVTISSPGTTMGPGRPSPTRARPGARRRRDQGVVLPRLAERLMSRWGGAGRRVRPHARLAAPGQFLPRRVRSPSGGG